MARVYFVFLVIAAAVLLVESKSPRKCPKHERWNDCATACPPTCEEPNPGPCTLECRMGCECKPGFLRNANGQCIQKSRCSRN